MTSVSVISAVAARIQHLLEPLVVSNDSQSWRNDADKLCSGLEIANSVLKDADQEKRQSKQFLELEKQIVQLAYDIDDSLSSSVLGLAPPGSIFSRRSFQRNPEKNSKADLETLRRDLVNFTESLEKEITLEPNKNEQEERTAVVVPTQAITGAAAEDPPAACMEDRVIQALMEKDELPVVCIWGKSGMGKTTLGKKVFYDRRVRQHFEVFAWVSINRDLKTKKVLQDILLQLLPDGKVDVRGMDEFELTQEIFTVHKEKKCLVVLEDIWSKQDWRSIRVAFPIGQSISKILITTPVQDVAEAATSQGGLFEMKPLSEAECFKMLQETANFELTESQDVEKAIFSLSGGSRLHALVLGKSLKTTDGAARDQLLHELASFQSRNQIHGGETKVLRLSYDRLPHELKPCLLYMGQFPEGQDIQVEKLSLLLAAEGLITSPDRDTGTSTKTISVRNILDELARKMLVEVQEDKVSTTRMHKSCRLHDQIRKFCQSQGLDEDFFQIVDFKSREKIRPSIRRLAVYLNKYEDGDDASIPFSNQDMMKKIRSLLIFDITQQKSTWPSEVNDLKEFIRLRVLHFNGVDFRVRKFPKGIEKLVLLRYLSFGGCYMDAFPSSISNFPCLETLDLRINPDCKMIIPNVLNNMIRLKHLYFPKVYESDGNTNKLQLEGLEMLETLVNFDTAVCKIEDLSGLNNIRTLTIISEGHSKDLNAIIKCLDGKSANLQHLSVDIRNLDCYTDDRVDIFKKLLQLKCLHCLHVEGQICKLPDSVAISPSFTEMVFDGSDLKVDPMNILGKLQNLRSLVLSNDAFVGNEMTFSTSPDFPNLRILKLLNLHYLEKLTIEEGAMPELSNLVIENCGDLKKLLMPKALDERLKLAQGEKGDDVYLVEPLPDQIHYT